MVFSRDKNPYGQYFTPRSVADLMLELSTSSLDSRVLEPSSGAGVFLDALSQAGYSNVDAVEIDPLLAHHDKFHIHNTSFVSWQPNSEYDLVIGNPPYIRWKDLGDAAKSEMKNHKLFGSLFNSLSDYLTVFIACSIEHLCEGGELIFITPSFWMHTQHSNSLRTWMLSRGCITDVLDFGEASVFPGVSSAIIIFRFVKGATSQTINHFIFTGPRRVPTEKLSLSNKEFFDARLVREFLPETHWTLATEEELLPVEQLELACSRSDRDLLDSTKLVVLGDFVNIANGMVSGLDAAFRIPTELVPHLNEYEMNATYRVLKAFQIQPFYSPEYCLYIDAPNGLSNQEFENFYPNFEFLLRPHKDELLARYSYGRDLPYWEWAFKRSEAFFTNGQRKGFVACKERITQRSKVRFTLTSPLAVATQDVTAFAPKDGVRESIEYIVAYLNYQPVSEWIKRRGLIKGGIAEFSERPLSSIPFRGIDWDVEAEVLVHDRIINLMEKHSLSSFDEQNAILQEINDMVAKLVNSL